MIENSGDTGVHSIAVHTHVTRKIDAQGDLHCDTGPALTLPNGDQEWYIHGKRHREDGPAIEHTDWKEYYINGKKHRSDGPALIYTGADFIVEKWYHNGRLHAKGGPATFRKDLAGNVLYETWYNHGKKHRIDGPAIKSYTHNFEEWWKNGVVHREDGPAITSSVDQYWFNDGIIHRDEFEGPAIEYANSTKEWRTYGDRQRLFEPAVVYANGNCEYWTFGYQTSRVWNELLSSLLIHSSSAFTELDYLSHNYDLMSEMLPANIMGKSAPIYCIDVDFGHLHNETSPSYISDTGIEHWCYDGHLHREDGPAIYGADIAKWYLYGEEYDFDDWLEHTDLDESDKLFYMLKYSVSIT